MTTIQKTLIILGITILAAITIFLIGRRIGEKSQDNKNIVREIEKTEVKIGLTNKQIDSIYKELDKNQKVKIQYVEKEIGVIKQIEKVVIEKPKDTVCNDLYNKATLKINLLNDRITIKDSIEKNSNKIIKNQYSIINKKDSIISFKDTQLNLYKNKKTTPKRIGVGIQVGYGVSVSKNKFETAPYVGVGLSYNVFNF